MKILMSSILSNETDIHCNKPLKSTVAKGKGRQFNKNTCIFFHPNNLVTSQDNIHRQMLHVIGIIFSWHSGLAVLPHGEPRRWSWPPSSAPSTVWCCRAQKWNDVSVARKKDVTHFGIELIICLGTPRPFCEKFFDAFCFCFCFFFQLYLWIFFPPHFVSI